MRKSLIASVLLHVAILLWALVEFPFAREFDTTEMPSLPIDLVSPSELTKIKAGTKDAKKEEPSAKPKQADKASETEKDEPKKRVQERAVAPAAEPEPAEPVPAKVEKVAKAEPKPEPAPEKKETAAAPPPLPRPAPPKPKPKAVEKKPEPKKVVEREAPKRKSEFDADRIAALLNKVHDTGPKAAPKAPDANPAPPANGMTSGQDLTMSMSELDALRQRISQCWIPPVGGMGAEQIRVRLRLQLNPDGSLVRQPEVVNRESSAFFQVAADSAVRAVWQCQPYTLPAAKYALWRDMILNFDPREMFGG